MRSAGLSTLIAAVALLAACEAKIGKEADADATSGNQAAKVSAEGKAKEGQFSIKAPGFDLKLDIPKGIAEHASFDSDSDILYPGATLSGMHVEAGADKAAGRHNSAVELRFKSGDDPDKVAAWYRDPARAADFSIASAARTGSGYTIEGVQKDKSEPFTLHLAPIDGGTDGRLTLRDRG